LSDATIEGRCRIENHSRRTFRVSTGSNRYGERSGSVLSASRSTEEGPARPDGDGSGSLRDEEGALVGRAVAGDREAWRALYEQHGDFAFRVAARFLADESEARDVAHDVFVDVFTRVSTYRPEGRFRTYLYRVVANRCLNERARVRHRRRAAAGSDEDALAAVPDGAGSPEDHLARAQEAKRVRAAIARLPDRQRLAVILSRFEELSYEKIAAALETTVSSVESLLFRARRTLAQELEGL
jgi:RNA polymerase sigma-70 factor (ECF subfamily)